jgi:hypothetical protein
MPFGVPLGWIIYSAVFDSTLVPEFFVVSSGPLREFFGVSGGFFGEFPKPPRRDPEAAPKRSRSRPEAIPKPHRSDPEADNNETRSRPEAVPKPSRSPPEAEIKKIS